MNVKSLPIKVRLGGVPKRYRTYARFILQTIFLLCLLNTSDFLHAEEQPKSVISVEELKELAAAVDVAERSLFSNLRLESETWLETKTSLSDPNEIWKRTPIYVSSTSWLEGRSKGKARVDVHKQITEWRNGAAPHAEESYSIGFDGSYGRIVHYTTGPIGKAFPFREAEIVPDYPEQLRTSFLRSCTGAAFSLQFFFDDDEDGPKRRTFSRFFQAATSPAALKANAFEFSFEEFHGVECIKFGTGKQKWGSETWWFDPSRGFALLGYQHVNVVNSSERLIAFMKVDKLKKVMPGVWWPVEASILSDPNKTGEPYTRTVYRASKVFSNDPNFDKSIFTVPLPEGYLVDDKVKGIKYKVGQEQKTKGK